MSIRGIDSFINNNSDGFISKFDSCLRLILYAHSLIKTEKKTYSRGVLKKTLQKLKGKADRLPLEDYLRNDLVNNYINPNRYKFGLDYYQFEHGVEETIENFTIGILDIKVYSPLLTGDLYFIFECKRLNKTILDNYFTEGVYRFTSRKYYPSSDVSVAGMISFLEADNESKRITLTNSFNEIKSGLLKHKNYISLINEELTKYSIASSEANNEELIYKSSHNRDDSTPINIYHIILDYNAIVID